MYNWNTCSWGVRFLLKSEKVETLFSVLGGLAVAKNPLVVFDAYFREERVCYCRISVIAPQNVKPA